MTEKGCDNCYYSFFDERAYPCSLCIRGVERTDQWQPSRKTKADQKTEPQTEIKVEPTWVGTTYGRFEDEPQTSGVMWTENDMPTPTSYSTSASTADTPQTDCAWGKE